VTSDDTPAESEAVRMVRAADARRPSMIPEVRDRGEEVAVLMDFENLVLGAIASLPGRAEPVPDKALTWLCRAYGSSTIRRAYADWADPRFGRYQNALERNGVDLVQIGHGPARKNGADIRMAVDAMETLIVHPGVDAFVLVTGDSDFSPLVSKLREHGKYVIGVGAETAVSARLVSVCTEYKLFGSIVASIDPPPDAADRPRGPANARPPAPALEHSLADAETLLVTAMEQITAATPTASAVKSKMVALDPTFDPLNYGFRSFRDFLAQIGHRVRTVGRSGHDITLALIDQPTGVTPPPSGGATS